MARTSTKLRSVATPPAQPEPSYAYEYRDRQEIARKDWAAIHVRADRSPALEVPAPHHEAVAVIARFADAIGIAMLALYALNLASFAVALAAGAAEPAWLFLGAAIACGATLCLISWFEGRLHG